MFLIFSIPKILPQKYKKLFINSNWILMDVLVFPRLVSFWYSPEAMLFPVKNEDLRLCLKFKIQDRFGISKKMC